MGRYVGRHSARHAAPRIRRGPHLSRVFGVSGPVALSLAIAAGTAAAGVSHQHATTVDATSDQVADEAPVLTVSQLQSAARLTTERGDRSSERAQLRAEVKAQAEAEAKAKADAAAAARKEEAERAARDAERQAEADRIAAALEPTAAQKNPQLAAQILMPEYGFGQDQWRCLESLWIGESDWQWSAENPSSGAYGIPQSLPADKMAEQGADWKTNPVTQIRWGLNYIKLSYGTPCNALEFWNAQDPHWY